MSVRVCVVVGTRPEIVKMASVIHALRERRADFVLVHTGQHYDENLSGVFFRELELPAPDVNLETGSGTQAEQTATAMIRLEKTFRDVAPDVVLVEGDTNTVLAAALAAAKMGIDVGHVEAGLRSYDRRMPEEHNRRLTDHLSALLFAPTERAAANLRGESCWGTIHVTGNTVIDACLRYGPKAAQSPILKEIPFERFALATAHRAENVDDPRVLREFFKVFTECPLPVRVSDPPADDGPVPAGGFGGDVGDVPERAALAARRVLGVSCSPHAVRVRAHGQWWDPGGGYRAECAEEGVCPPREHGAAGGGGGGVRGGRGGAGARGSRPNQGFSFSRTCGQRNHGRAGSSDSS